MKFSELKNNLDNKNKSSNSNDSTNKVKNLEAILNVVKRINNTIILEEVLEVVLHNAIEITESERGFIVLENNEKQGELKYKLGLDSEDNKLFEESFEVSQTVVNDVFFTGQSKFIEGAQSDSYFGSSKSILNLELQTILCSPLITEGNKIGVIYVDSTHLHKIKIKDITETFEVLAGQAGTAIKNAQLYLGQLNAYNALNEANVQLIQAERKTLKSSLDAEIGTELQGLVHMALLEVESLSGIIQKNKYDFNDKNENKGNILFDRLRLKSKVAIDSIRIIQKYANALIESSTLTLKKNSKNLNETIQNVIQYLSPTQKFFKVKFNTLFSDIPDCKYDSEQIEHLFVHLFNNSAEAKSNVKITVKTIVVEKYINITIEDDGPGIPKEKMENIFGLPTLTEKGYGLFLCKNIMERHNGSIKFLQKDKGICILLALNIS